MQTNGIFTVHKFDIQCNVGEPINLIPFGDIHHDSPMHSKEAWLDFLEMAKGLKGKKYFLGMGDYLDLASTSEREILSNNKLHESSKQTLEGLYTRNINRLCDELKFMGNGTLIGLLEGNHYSQFPDGTTSTQRMCNKLNTTYLGCSSVVRLSFAIKGSIRKCVDIFAHHGRGAARLVGGSLNRVQQMSEAVSADIFCMGHDHKKSAATSSRLFLSTGRGGLMLKHKKQLYIRTGSFLKGYEPGEASYVADGCYSPSDLGCVVVTITPTRNRKGHADDVTMDLSART